MADLYVQLAAYGRQAQMFLELRPLD